MRRAGAAILFLAVALSIHRRWEFDLLLSNPDAARLYRLPFAKYAAEVGCQDH